MARSAWRCSHCATDGRSCCGSARAFMPMKRQCANSIPTRGNAASLLVGLSLHQPRWEAAHNRIRLPDRARCPHARAFFGGWRVHLMVDDYAGYKSLFSDDVTELACLARVRRNSSSCALPVSAQWRPMRCSASMPCTPLNGRLPP